MARPRKDQEGPTAVERMEEAFWEILAEKPYAQITVGEIAKRAQVNKKMCIRDRRSPRSSRRAT